MFYWAEQTVCYSIIRDTLNSFFLQNYKTFNRVLFVLLTYNGRGGLADRNRPWTTVWQPVYQLQLMYISADIISFQYNQHEIMDSVLCKPACQLISFAIVTYLQ
jgi:hypothetical protein